MDYSFFCARPHVTREVLRASSSFEHATFRFVSSSPRSSYFTYLQIATPLIINQMKCSRNHGSAVWVPLNCVTFFYKISAWLGYAPMPIPHKKILHSRTKSVEKRLQKPLKNAIFLKEILLSCERGNPECRKQSN